MNQASQIDQIRTQLSQQRANDLAEQIDKTGLGDHLCLIYETAEEQLAAVVPYIQLGLERNEYCAYIVDDRTLEEVQGALISAGIDVKSAIARGQLSFLTKREAYLESGAFDPHLMMNFLDHAVHEAVNKGYTGFRVVGEMTWGLGNECGCDRLIEYENLLNEFFPGSKATAICAYNKNRFSPEMIRDVLRTHPIAILGNEVCDNLYYETPKMILGEESVAKRTEWMIQGLKRHRKTERSLENAIQVRDNFLSIASHELNTPVTSLKLQTQGLSRLLRSTPPGESIPREKLENSLQTTERQIHRLSKLISNLLDVSKIGSGKLSLDTEHLELNDVVTQVIERTSELARAAGSPVEFKVHDTITGTWDRFRLEQVFINLITNALKYGDGKPIEIALGIDNHCAQVSIRDSGIGIAKEHLERIFERFERAIPASTVSGLGLGLYIAREIVHAHDGNIDVDSKVGHGSTFTVKLPIKPGLSCAVTH